MKKVFLIGWKDVTLAFRDRAALIFMLAAPFILTLGMGFVTGRFSGTVSSGIADIPVILVNQDAGRLGEELLNVFESDDLAELMEPVRMQDVALARQQVDEDQAAALVIIPAGFTDSVTSAQEDSPLALITFYSNPTRPTSAGVIKTIVDAFVNQVEVNRVSVQVTLTQLMTHELVPPDDLAVLAGQISTREKSGGSLTLKNVTSAGEAVKFDVLALLAPGMALMFLMFTVSNGGRSLLTERAQGTLPRLLTSPTTTAQVLGGKVFGIFLTGVAQMLILILASSLFFQLKWGDPLAVLVLVLAAVFGAVGWGLLITALAHTPGQVGAVGSAVMLLFGILGGSFVSLDNMPLWFQAVSKITPNAWGLDGFNVLALGGRLADVGSMVLALLVMGAVLFAASALVFSRRSIAQA